MASENDNPGDFSRNSIFRKQQINRSKSKLGDITIKVLIAIVSFVSNYLRISALLAISEKYLSRKVSSGNVLDLLLFAIRFELHVLHQECVNLIQSNSEMLSENSKLENFTLKDFNMIFSVLSKQKNNLTLKEILFRLSIKWLKKDFYARSPYLSFLLKSILISEISSEFLKEVVAKEPLICDSEICSSLLVDALNKTSNEKSQSISETRHIYCLGGMEARTYGSPMEKRHFLTSVSKLDISTGKWSSGTNRKNNRLFYASAVVRDKIYLIGGKIDEKPQSSMEMLDCSTGSWKRRTPLPEARAGAAAVALGNFIYVSGGAVYHGNTTFITSNMLRYNIRTNEWKRLKYMPEARIFHYMVALNGKIYSIGGTYSGHRVDQYNPDTDSWSDVPNTATRCVNFNAAVHNGKIWIRNMESIIPGYTGYWDGFEVYTPETNSWEMLSAPCKHYADRLVSINNELWAFGSEVQDGGDNYPKVAYVFDAEKTIWERKPDIRVFRFLPDVFGVTLGKFETK